LIRRVSIYLVHLSRPVGQSRPNSLVESLPRFGQHTREKGGGATGPNPLDRGRPGSKRHIITDASGVPLAVMLTAANVHDSKVFEALIDSIAPVKGIEGQAAQETRQTPRG
jgi:hypothetical protein